MIETPTRKSNILNFLDQNQVQNTSLDSVTAYNPCQQPKTNLKSRYETKTGLKNVKLIKKLKKRNQKSKIKSKSSIKALFELGSGYKSKISPKLSLKTR